MTIHDDPIAHFLSGYEKGSWPFMKVALRQFLAWLNQREGWAGIGPKELLIRQLQADDPYAIPELIQAFANSFTDIRKPTILQKISLILHFFEKNRCPLPEDVTRCWFQVHSTVPAAQSRLTVQVIRGIILGLPLRWRSLFLVKYQAMLDTNRLCWLNTNGADQVTQQLREGRKIVRLTLPYRRKYFGRREWLTTYSTYFGRDAASNLTWYFDRERGWPKSGEPIWVYTDEDLMLGKNSYQSTRHTGSALLHSRIGAKWLALTRSMNYVPRNTIGRGRRYGYNLQEFRNVAMSELYTHARNRGLDMDCVKYWCGLMWRIDPGHSDYDKFYRNSEYMERQYAIAEPYLNIITGTPEEKQASGNTGDNPQSFHINYTVSTRTEL